MAKRFSITDHELRGKYSHEEAVENNSVKNGWKDEAYEKAPSMSAKFLRHAEGPPEKVRERLNVSPEN